MTAPRWFPRNQTSKAKIIRRLFNPRLLELTMTVKQPLSAEVLNGGSRCQLMKIVTSLRVQRAGRIYQLGDGTRGDRASPP
jgi:hypothetical protein